MGALLEREIFDCLKTNLRGAADDCDQIAKQPRSGALFDQMRKRLKLCEGACRQAAFWREDSRWLKVGLKMEQAHQIARTWLHRPTVKSKKLFTSLAAALRKVERDVERLERGRTGIMGMILPTPEAPPLRQGRPVQVITPRGILLP